jgi:hypothetical protein
MKREPKANAYADQITNLYREGYGQKYIAKFLGLTRANIKYFIDRSDFKQDRKGLNGFSIIPVKRIFEIKKIENRIKVNRVKKQRKLSTLPLFRWAQHRQMTIRQMERYHNDPKYKEAFYARKARYRSKQESKEKAVSYSTKWRKTNPDRFRASKRKNRKIPWNRIKHNLRNRIADLIKGKASASSSVGCNSIALRIHLQEQFKPGMSWDNYGTEWHVDHIMPLAAAECEEHLIRLNHFSNLQPLWAKENMTKGAKIHSPLMGPSTGGRERVCGNSRNLVRD